MQDSSLSASQVKKLGSRLRKSERPSETDLYLLQQFRALHDRTLAQVAAELTGIGFEPTTRLKTVDTIVQKLHRQTTMSLSGMQDVAGARVVRDCTLEEQDEFVVRVTAQFAEHEVVDRRFGERGKSTLRVGNLKALGPSYGYRAVHIVVTVDRQQVEVQLRTWLQDLWAQVVERIADVWGRSIRYGEDPENPDLEIQGGWTRRSFVDALGLLSQNIAMVEAWPSKIGARNAALGQRQRALKSQIRKGGKDYAASVHELREVERTLAEGMELETETDVAKHDLAKLLSEMATVGM